MSGGKFTGEGEWSNHNGYHHVEFEYDFADIPFSPPTRNTGYLESGSPYFRASGIADSSNRFHSTASTLTSSSEQKPVTPLVKLVAGSISSRSQENVSGGEQKDLHHLPSTVTQSLPATPSATPGPTPLNTPVPTPHASPSTTRKEMEVVARVAQDQLSNKWFQLGFLSSVKPTQENRGSNVEEDVSISKYMSQEFRPLSYLQKKALAISNRDMNFLAPTSM